ncbi:MAG: hypothetical protein IKV21_05705, partial [Clostridia bacterium]|nr:hypothetical protein [Clostridia bacterium]
MKKLLSVLLATLMLFSVMSMSASAAILDENHIDDYKGQYQGTGNFIICFNVFGYTASGEAYDTELGRNVASKELTGKFYVLPQGTYDYTLGSYVFFPTVSLPTEKKLDGWRCNTTFSKNNVYGTDYVYIDQDMYNYAMNNGGIIEFEIDYSSAKEEEDTMGNILGILSKVFGAIIGLLVYN